MRLNACACLAVLSLLGTWPARLSANPSEQGQSQPCAHRGTAIVVQIDRQRLFLCLNGVAARDFPVAVGSGGRAKQAEGDKRTPIGTYPLGPPRTSKDFHIFIPVDYPTQVQRKSGATGGDVGIHGPKRRYAWAGRLNTWINWTRGCIAVATDAEIQAIADWIRREQPALIHIE